MNLAQNKFLVGFGAVVLVGVAGLGYYVSSESSRLEQEKTSYTQKAQRYNALRQNKPYPDESNLKKLEEQKEGVVASADALQHRLASLSFPLEPITPQQFQGKLAAAVSQIISSAQAAGIEMPPKFYLGFEDYESTLASAEMAPILYREMRVIESIISTLITAKVAKIGPVNRTPIPGETGSAKSSTPTPRATPANPRNQAAAQANAQATPQKDLVTRYPFTVEFTSDQRQFRNILNTIATNDKQFLVIRNVKVKNTHRKPVAKERPSVPVLPALPVDAEEASTSTPTPPPTAASLQYVLGTEKVEVTLALDMVVVASRNAQ